MSTLHRRILPGFRLSLSYALTYLTILVLMPLVACFAKASTLTWDTFWGTVWTERALAAYELTFGASFAAAVVDVALGLLIAWVLVRYEFPLKSLFDAIIDLPLALPTAVAGLVYSSLYVQKGWFGQFLVPLGIEGAYSRLAIVLVLTFIGLPLTVRTIQPVLATCDDETEEAAACLGASRFRTFSYVILPTLYPAMLTGFALAFARALGEYGSVVFVSGNMPYRTEIAPVLIVTHDQEEALEVADRVVIMNKGKAEQIGTPEEVYDHPATPFVYDFLGNVNLFHGRIHEGQARLGEFEIEVPEHADAQDIPAVGYVRPYDIEVERHRNGAPAIEAIVSHIQRIGPLVHLELTRGDTGDLIEVELSKERYWEMQIAPGERVFITPRQLKVFAQGH